MSVLFEKCLPNILVALFYGLVVVMTSMLMGTEGADQLASTYVGVLGGLALSLAQEKKEQAKHEKEE